MKSLGNFLIKSNHSIAILIHYDNSLQIIPCTSLRKHTHHSLEANTSGVPIPKTKKFIKKSNKIPKYPTLFMGVDLGGGVQISLKAVGF